MYNIEFDKVRFSNFMSFGREFTEVKLNTGHNFLILGKNNDVGDVGESANGVGKTTIMQAIIFALYGSGIEKMNADEFVNLTNERKLVVELDLKINGVDYKIIRKRKSSELELWKGEESLTRDSMANTDKDIQTLLGISFDVFVRTIFMNSHIEPFMAMTPANQRNMMESILSLDVLASRAKVLKDVIRKDVSDEIKLIERDLQNATASNTKIRDHIEKLRRACLDYDAEHLSKIKAKRNEIASLEFDEVAIRNELEILEGMDVELANAMEVMTEIDKLVSAATTKKTAEEQNLIKLERAYQRRDEYNAKHVAEINEAEAALARLPSPSVLNEYLDLESDYEKIKSSVAVNNERLKTIDQMISRSTAQLNSTIDHAEALAQGKCPTCKQEHFDDVKLDELATKAEALNAEIEGHEAEKAAIASALDVEGKLEALAKELSEILIYNDNIEDYSSTRELATKRAALQAVLDRAYADNPHEIAICDLELEFGGVDDIKARINSHISQIVELSVELNEELAKSDQLGDEKARYKNAMKFKTIHEVEMALLKKANLEDEHGNLCMELNPYTDMMESQAELLIDCESIVENKERAEKELTHINYLIKLLTDPKSFVRKNIIDQYLPFLNKKITEYSEVLGMNHVASINSDMTTDIEYMHKKTSYFTMSRGERLRLNVATSLAFRDLTSILGHSCNLLLADELLDGSSDASGVRRIFDLIKRYVPDVFIISHRAEFKDQVDKNMTVIKSNGFADIEIS